MKRASYYFMGIICLMTISGCSEEVRNIETPVEQKITQTGTINLSGNEVTTKGLVYENVQFWFKTKLPENWKDYKVITVGNSINFYLPTQEKEWKNSPSAKIPGYSMLFWLYFHTSEEWSTVLEKCKIVKPEDYESWNCTNEGMQNSIFMETKKYTVTKLFPQDAPTDFQQYYNASWGKNYLDYIKENFEEIQNIENTLFWGLPTEDIVQWCETYEECISLYKNEDRDNPGSRDIMEIHAKEGYKILQKIYSTAPTLSGSIIQSGATYIIWESIKEFAKRFHTKDSLRFEETTNYGNTINFLRRELIIKKFLEEAQTEADTFREPTPEELVKINRKTNKDITLSWGYMKLNPLEPITPWGPFPEDYVDIWHNCNDLTIIDSWSWKIIEVTPHKCEVYTSEILSAIPLNKNRIAINSGEWYEAIMFDLLRGEDWEWKIDFISPYNPSKKENPRIIMFRLNEKALWLIWQTYKSAWIIK